MQRSWESQIKLYPEGKSEGRFKIRGVKRIIYYCNHDGLFYVDVVRGIDDKEKENRKLYGRLYFSTTDK